MDKPHVLLVGHCGPDAYAIKSAVSSAVPGASVAMVTDAGRLEAELPRASLLLVNRVLDGSFEHEGGIELIRALSEREGAPPAMLVSNFAEAQAEAQAAGAVPGFGKTALYAADTKARIRSAIGIKV